MTDQIRPAVRLTDLRKSFGAFEVLKGISLEAIGRRGDLDPRLLAIGQVDHVASWLAI